MKSLALGLLRFYKRWISPVFRPACRYVPTCSEYATEAVERYGALRGSAMAGWRVLRCHPLAKGGYDPVVKDAGFVASAPAFPVETRLAASQNLSKNCWVLKGTGFSPYVRTQNDRGLQRLCENSFSSNPVERNILESSPGGAAQFSPALQRWVKWQKR